MNEMRIYVASLYDYNDGRLEGKWLDLADYSDASELMEAIEEMLDDLTKKYNDGEVREEWAVHDYEGIPSTLASEYMSEQDFQQLYDIAEVADDRGIPVEVLVERAGDTGSDDYQALADSLMLVVDGNDESDIVSEYEFQLGSLGYDFWSNHIYIDGVTERVMYGEDVDRFREDILYDNPDMDEDEAERQAEEMANEEEYRREDLTTYLEDMGYEGEIPSFVSKDYEGAWKRSLSYDLDVIHHDGEMYVFTNNYSLGGTILSGMIGAYIGYKVGRAKPQKKGFETEKRIGRKIKGSFSKKKMARGGGVSYNKNWEVVGITSNGKMFKERITLGRMSDKEDVKNALNRRTDLNIREITSIKEVFAKGGSNYQGGGEIISNELYEELHKRNDWKIIEKKQHPLRKTVFLTLSKSGDYYRIVPISNGKELERGATYFTKIELAKKDFDKTIQKYFAKGGRIETIMDLSYGQLLDLVMNYNDHIANEKLAKKIAEIKGFEYDAVDYADFHLVVSDYLDQHTSNDEEARDVLIQAYQKTGVEIPDYFEFSEEYAQGGGVGEDVSKSLYVSELYDDDGNFLGYTIQDKYNVSGKYTLTSSKERAEENRQYLIDNPSRLAYYRKNEYARGGSVEKLADLMSYLDYYWDDPRKKSLEKSFFGKNIDVKVNLITEGELELAIADELEKIKMLSEKVDFDEVRGEIDYGKGEDNTNLQFYKNGQLVMTLKGDYNSENESLDTIIELNGETTELNYHPADGFGGVSLSTLNKNIYDAFSELGIYSAVVSIEGYEEYSEDVKGLENAKELIQNIKGNTKFQVLKGRSVGIGKRVDDSRVVEEYAKGGGIKEGFAIMQRGSLRTDAFGKVEVFATKEKALFKMSHVPFFKTLSKEEKEKLIVPYISSKMAKGGGVDEEKIWKIIYKDRGVQKSILVEGYSHILEANNWRNKNPTKEFIQIQLYGNKHSKGGGVLPTRTIGDMTYKVFKDGNGYNVSASKEGYSAWKVGKPMSKVEAVKLLNSLVDTKGKGNRFEDGGGVEGHKHVLHIDGQNWFLEKIDSTHFYMSNDHNYRGMAHHIGQHKGEPYYEEVREWLKTTYAKGGGVDDLREERKVIQQEIDFASNSKSFTESERKKYISELNQDLAYIQEKIRTFYDSNDKYAKGGGVDKLKKGDKVYAYLIYNDGYGYDLVESPSLGNPEDGEIIEINNENGRIKYKIRFDNGTIKNVSEGIFDDYIYKYANGGGISGLDDLLRG